MKVATHANFLLTLNASTGTLVSSGNFFVFSSRFQVWVSWGVNLTWVGILSASVRGQRVRVPLHCRSPESMRRVTPAETWWIWLCLLLSLHSAVARLIRAVMDNGTRRRCPRGESAKSGPAQPHWDKWAIFHNFSA